MRPAMKIYEFLYLCSHLNMVVWHCGALMRLFFEKGVGVPGANAKGSNAAASGTPLAVALAKAGPVEFT